MERMPLPSLPRQPKPKRLPQFRTIDLRLLDSSSSSATGLGNNAAWLCPCGHPLPLIASLAIAREVACPGCSRHYRVTADSDNRSGSVEEVEPDSTQS